MIGDLISHALGLEVRVSALMPPTGSFRDGNLVWVGNRTYREIQWLVEERKKWSGRDWRRLKRERRKFVRRGDA